MTNFIKTFVDLQMNLRSAGPILSGFGLVLVLTHFGLVLDLISI